MRENPDWTLITKGEEKYLVYADLDIQYLPIGNMTLMRINLRSAHGGHYLDIVTVVTDFELAQGKDEDIVQIQKGNGDSCTQHDHHKVSMLRVEKPAEVQVAERHHEVATDTDEITSYVDELKTNSRSSHSLTGTPNQGEPSGTKITCRNLERCLENAQQVNENPDATEEEKCRAIDEMQSAMDDLKGWTLYCGSRKNELRYHLNAMETLRRKASRQEAASRDDEDLSNTTGSVDEPAVGDQIYAEYDKHFQAAQETKRRVRFQEQLEEESEARARQQSKSSYDQGKKSEQTHAGSRNTVTHDRKDFLGVDEDNQYEDVAANDNKKRKASERYDMYKTKEYSEVTKGGVQTYCEDKFSANTTINTASDFTLAVFMMENNVHV